MDKFNHQRRRKMVRFDLPEPIENHLPNTATATQYNARKPKEHETLTYVNGTLMSVSQRTKTTIKPLQNNIDSTTHQRTYQALPLPVSIRLLPSVSCLKPSASAASRAFDLNNHPVLQSSGKSRTSNDIDYRNRITSSKTTAPANVGSATAGSVTSYHGQYTTGTTACDKKLDDARRFAVPVGGSTILTKLKSTTHDIDKLKAKHIVVVNSPPAQPISISAAATTKKHKHNNTKNRMPEPDSLTIADRFARFRLFEDILIRKRKALKLSEKADRKVFYLKPLRSSVPQASEMGGMKRYLFCSDNHTNLVADLIQRWSRMRLREETELKFKSDQITTQKDPLETAVSFRNLKASDVKRFGCLKMSLEKEQTVPILLRAARDADNYLLKIVFKQILIDGITPDSLNSTDKSGRTALSYISSTDFTHFLDILLQLPGIDVNLGDNEGNTPLHFAAQSGQAEILNMLLTRCRNLQIDAKNCWGFTPMMKAALQGKTKCAKLLLFAGASSVTTDSSRRLNASEWARFTGREACAEMLEKCAKARRLEKPTSFSTKTRTRSPKNVNNLNRSESLMTKLNRFLPFKSSIKVKQQQQAVQKTPDKLNSKDLGNYLTNSALCGSGPALPTKEKTQLNALVKPDVNVPKLIITQQNDIEMMKKYEKPPQKLPTANRRIRN